MGPGKDTHGTLGPEQRGGRGWPTPTPKGRSAHAMTRTQDSPTHKSSDKHGSGAGHQQLQVTITNRRRRLSRYRTNPARAQRPSSRMQLQPSAQIQRFVKESVGEKLTDEDAEKMIEETDVNNAQWKKNVGVVHHATGARAESHSGESR